LSNPVPFGRRAAKPETGRPRSPPARPAPPSEAAGLSAEADRFRASLAAERRGGPADFDRFMRAQRVQRVMAAGMQLALLLPGAFCFLHDAPRPVSAGLEILGLVVGVWLKQERKRRLKAIAGWRDEDQASA